MTIFDKIIIKLFFGTFEKVYKKGLSDAFNFTKFSNVFYRNDNIK